MNLLDAIARRLPAPRLTVTRVVAAFVVALACDGLQILLAPLGPVSWFFADEVLDLIAFVIITWLIGFHVLLLPTFAVEFIPVIGLLPTWTGCVATVAALRWRSHQNPPPASATATPPVVHSPPLLADAPPQLPPTIPSPSSDPTDANPS